jgi:hypothetical protein
VRGVVGASLEGEEVGEFQGEGGDVGVLGGGRGVGDGEFGNGGEGEIAGKKAGGGVW